MKLDLNVPQVPKAVGLQFGSTVDGNWRDEKPFLVFRYVDNHRWREESPEFREANDYKVRPDTLGREYVLKGDRALHTVELTVYLAVTINGVSYDGPVRPRQSTNPHSTGVYVDISMMTRTGTYDWGVVTPAAREVLNAIGKELWAQLTVEQLDQAWLEHLNRWQADIESEAKRWQALARFASQVIIDSL